MDVSTMDPRESDLKTSLYDTDFYTWTQVQADLIRSGRFAEADLSNIVEEIETLGRAEFHSLRSSYRLIMMHLLKMRFQPEMRTGSWTGTVVRERNNIDDNLRDNPGLRSKRAEAFLQAYPGARREAANETQLALIIFPDECPFSLEEIESHAFWPENATTD